MIDLKALLDKRQKVQQYDETGEYISFEAVSVEDIEKAAVEAMQKPLTLEETKIQLAVWVERLPRFEGERVTVRPETYSGEYRDVLNYGKTWRCWLKKPTDEERKAAEWE